MNIAYTSFFLSGTCFGFFGHKIFHFELSYWIFCVCPSAYFWPDYYKVMNKSQSQKKRQEPKIAPG